jgi:hypothetical protein
MKMPAEIAAKDSIGLVGEAFGSRVAELKRSLEPRDVVEVLSGDGSFARASHHSHHHNHNHNHNHNQNQTGT